MKTYKQLKKELLANKKTKQAYDELGPGYELVRAIIRKRNELGITQEELARRIGTKQSSIARLESGTYNPSIAFLEKTAKALDSHLEVKIK